MRKFIFGAVALVGVVVVLQSAGPKRENPAPTKPAGPSGPKLETLLRSVLEGVDSTEVILSRLTIPPNTSLPKHWHPGEEFAYVLEGSVTLWQRGKDDIVGKTGDVLAVPLHQVHTAVTTAEGGTVLVFRVHRQGQPERVLVAEDR
jgi:quercetin dioxygenase-like cupin family protein